MTRNKDFIGPTPVFLMRPVDFFSVGNGLMNVVKIAIHPFNIKWVEVKRIFIKTDYSLWKTVA